MMTDDVKLSDTEWENIRNSLSVENAKYSMYVNSNNSKLSNVLMIMMVCRDTSISTSRITNKVETWILKYSKYLRSGKKEFYEARLLEARDGPLLIVNSSNKENQNRSGDVSTSPYKKRAIDNVIRKKIDKYKSTREKLDDEITDLEHLYDMYSGESPRAST